MLKAFKLQTGHDLRILSRQPSTFFYPILFMLTMIALFGVGFGFNKNEFNLMSGQIIWIGFMLSMLLTTEQCLRREYDEGSLLQLNLSPLPLWWLVLAKTAAIWIVITLPLLIAIPVFSFFMQLSLLQMLMLLLSLLLGSPALILFGVLGTSLTLNLPSSGLLMGILLLPLFIPLLIFGINVIQVESLQDGLAGLALLASFSVLTITLIPHGIATALRAIDE